MTRAGLRVITYHRVIEPGATDGDPALISATPAGFEHQMRHLVRHYDVVSAADVAAACGGGPPLPRRAVLVTFDDATSDFGEVAWPILQRWRVPATVFVPTAFPDCPRRKFWWERVHRAVQNTSREAIDLGAHGIVRIPPAATRRGVVRLLQALVKRLPHEEAMALVEQVCSELGEGEVAVRTHSWSELRELAAAGVTLGAHTHTHPALTRIPAESAEEEIRQSREELTRQTGAEPRAFCYPFGDHNARVAAQVRAAGFAFAVTCIDGANHRAGDPMVLQRINVTMRTTPRLFALRLTPAGIAVDRWRHRRQIAAMRPAAAPAAPVKVAYMMSRFPKLSETFVLNEIAAMSAFGVPVEIYPLLREQQPVMHPDVGRWVSQARYVSWLSPRLLRAHARYLATQPATYLPLLVEVLRRNWGSRNLFIGALGTFPKAVQFADDAERRGVTHVHAHFATHPALAAFVVHRLTGIPFSFTAHGSDLHVDRRMLDAKVEAAAFVVAISRFNKEIIVRECGEGARAKVHVVHCGVDAAMFAPPARRHGGICRIVCVASLEEVKGHRFLIDACQLLRERGVVFECTLIGDGPERQALAEQIDRLGLADRIRLAGGLTRPAVIAHLEAADIAVLASHPTASGKREGIPVALMEAMAAELPVVSTAISGIPELVENGVSGLLVPSGRPDALAAAIERLAADAELRRRMGREGRQAVLREFDLHANACTLLTLCREGAR